MNAKFSIAGCYTGRRSRGRLDTYLAHWPQHPEIPAWKFSKAHLRLRDSKGCGFIPSRSENFRGDAAKLLFSSTKRNRPHLSSSSCPGASKKTGASAGRTVPFRRNPEQLNFTGKQTF